jgi:hypothetical protein
VGRVDERIEESSYASRVESTGRGRLGSSVSFRDRDTTTHRLIQMEQLGLVQVRDGEPLAILRDGRRH